MARTLKQSTNTAFWCVTLCSLVDHYWHFGGMYCIHLQLGRFEVLTAVTVKAELQISHEEFPFMN
jgi:hypothetical protein